MLKLYLVKIPNNIDNNLYNKLLSTLDIKRQSKIKKFKFIKDSYRSLVADMVSIYLLCEKLDKKICEINLFENEYGKPMVKDSKVKFNKSHSGDLVACGIDEEFDLGVDIELSRC